MMCVIRYQDFCLATLAIAAVIFDLGPAFAQSPWQNPVNRFDVNADTFLSADDLHQVVNGIRSDLTELPLPPTPPPYYDVSGDDPVPYLSPLDLLLLRQESMQPDAFSHGPPDISLAVPGPVRIRFDAVDFAGNPLTAVSVGTSFLVNAYVLDTRDAPQGVYAIYTDASFDDQLLTITDGPYVDGEYSFLAGDGSVHPGGISNLGGASTALLGPGTADERRIFSEQVMALAPGTAVFGGSSSYALLLGDNQPYSGEFSEYRVTIVPEPAWTTLPILLAAGVRRFRSGKTPCSR
jgi:FAD/FMN-containing dehydrogenase